MNEQQATKPIVPQGVQPPVKPVVQQNPPKPTNDQKPKPQTPYDLLGEPEKIAVEMRAKWIPYSYIVDAIEKVSQKRYKEQTLRDWFSINGRCFSALEFVRKQRSIQYAKELLEVQVQLKETAIDAIGVLRKGIQEGTIDKEARAAAESILDRAGFPKVSKVEGTQSVSVEASKSFTDSIAAIANSLKK